MKHATPQTLKSLSGLLNKIRLLPELKEKKLGVFYRKSRAFLHFHEDGDEIYADIRFEGSDFDRMPATTRNQQAALLTEIRKGLGA